MLKGINIISTTTIKEIDFWTFLILTAIAGILTFLGAFAFRSKQRN